MKALDMVYFLQLINLHHGLAVIKNERQGQGSNSRVQHKYGKAVLYNVQVQK